MSQPFAITGLVVSPRHRYDGRPADGPADLPPGAVEQVDSVDVRAHKGLVGDRYFGTRHTFASVTLIAEESLLRLEGELGTGPFDPTLARRNVICRGLDVEALVHHEFTLRCGDSAVRLRSLTRANPCAWMNEVFAPGAHQAMRGHAGIRCEPLTDGRLALGPATLTDVRALNPDELSRRVRAATPRS